MLGIPQPSDVAQYAIGLVGVLALVKGVHGLLQKEEDVRLESAGSREFQIKRKNARNALMVGVTTLYSSIFGIEQDSLLAQVQRSISAGKTFSDAFDWFSDAGAYAAPRSVVPESGRKSAPASSSAGPTLSENIIRVMCTPQSGKGSFVSINDEGEISPSSVPLPNSDDEHDSALGERDALSAQEESQEMLERAGVQRNAGLTYDEANVRSICRNWFTYKLTILLWTVQARLAGISVGSLYASKRQEAMLSAVKSKPGLGFGRRNALREWLTYYWCSFSLCMASAGATVGGWFSPVVKSIRLGAARFHTWWQSLTTKKKAAYAAGTAAALGLTIAGLRYYQVRRRTPERSFEWRGQVYTISEAGYVLNGIRDTRRRVAALPATAFDSESMRAASLETLDRNIRDFEEKYNACLSLDEPVPNSGFISFPDSGDLSNQPVPVVLELAQVPSDGQKVVPVKYSYVTNGNQIIQRTVYIEEYLATNMLAELVEGGGVVTEGGRKKKKPSKVMAYREQVGKSTRRSGGQNVPYNRKDQHHDDSAIYGDVDEEISEVEGAIARRHDGEISSRLADEMMDAAIRSGRINVEHRREGHAICKVPHLVGVECIDRTSGDASSSSANSRATGYPAFGGLFVSRHLIAAAPTLRIRHS